jgi:hypothetical protein
VDGLSIFIQIMDETAHMDGKRKIKMKMKTENMKNVG